MHDQFDNPVSCQSSAALHAYDRAVDAHLHACLGVPEALQEALEEAPDFALAHALRALVLAGRGQGGDAREAIGLARATNQADARERSQIELFGAVIEGRAGAALAAAIEHAGRYPGDVIASSTAVGAYGLFAFSGRADHDAARLAFVEALAAHHGDEFAWLLANRGWARIECGRVDEGMAMARQALALRAMNGHNAHILMHGFYESRQPLEALAFLDQWLPSYPDNALLWGHLQWHAALARIELGQIDQAVRLLLGPITDYLPRGTPFMGLADMASLLWRLGLRGQPALPWALAQEHAERHFPKGANVFGELHLAMLAAVRADRDALDAALERLSRIADTGQQGAPVAMQWVGALRAMLDDDRAAARGLLDACCQDAVRLGGSNAQRNVIGLTRETLRIPMIGT